MALTINIWCRFETVDAKGVRYRGGKKTTETPLTITTSGDAIHDQTHDIAASAYGKLWDTSDATTATDFEFLFLISDQDGEVMFSNQSNSTLWTHNTIANLPVILGTDASTYGASIASFGGTADDIEEVHWENGSSTTTARCRLVLAT